MRFSDQVVDAQESRYNSGAVYFDENNYASVAASHTEMGLAGYSLFQSSMMNFWLSLILELQMIIGSLMREPSTLNCRFWLLSMPRLKEWTSGRGTLLILQTRHSEGCQEYERLGVVILGS